MVGRGDHHGVDVFAIEHLAEVAVQVGLAADPLAGRFQGRLSDVAEGGHFDVAVVQERIEHLPSPVGHPDAADPNPLVGGEDPLGLRAVRVKAAAVAPALANVRRVIFVSGMMWTSWQVQLDEHSVLAS